MEPNPSGVVFPRSTEEVSQFMRLCDEYSVPVVPSGGRTGLSGGAVAGGGEWVLSLDRMNRVNDPDLSRMQVHVEAGAITQNVRDKCAERGVTWPIHFGAIGSSQIGGNIATNAGGHQVLRYGSVRNWVAGLTVVLANGDVLNLYGGVEKANLGFDLRQVFIGSEGTLGVITEADLKLALPPGDLWTGWLEVASTADALQVLSDLRSQHFTVDGMELIDQATVKVVTEHLGERAPCAASGSTYSLLLSIDLNSKDQTQIESRIEKWAESGWILDGAVATDSTKQKAFWKIRESIGEVLASRGRLHKNDVCLPLDQIEDFVTEYRKICAEGGIEPFVFGHLGDGNLHLNWIAPESWSDAETQLRTQSLDDIVFQAVVAKGGSISAEHGIGTLKRDGLLSSRPSTELVMMRGIKDLFDPKGILNPGKVYPPGA